MLTCLPAIHSLFFLCHIYAIILLQHGMPLSVSAGCLLPASVFYCSLIPERRKRELAKLCDLLLWQCLYPSQAGGQEGRQEEPLHACGRGREVFCWRKEERRSPLSMCVHACQPGEELFSCFKKQLSLKGEKRGETPERKEELERLAWGRGMK